MVHVAALGKSHKNGSIPFKGSNSANNRNNVPRPKPVIAATIIKHQQLTRAVTLKNTLILSVSFAEKVSRTV